MTKVDGAAWYEHAKYKRTRVAPATSHILGRSGGSMKRAFRLAKLEEPTTQMHCHEPCPCKH
jgi:hypothetical protein